MKTFTLQADIAVLAIRASSFPEGIGAAHRQVEVFCGTKRTRDFFGISHPDKHGNIEYFAAASLLKTDTHLPEKCTTLVVKAGKYAYIDVAEFSIHTKKIKAAFNTLLHHTELDQKGSCLEWYLENGLCRCMVRLIN